MPNRRELLQIGATVGAWSLTSSATRIAAASSPELLPIYKVIVDARYPESARFGDRAAAFGFATAAIAGDMTRVWYDDIYHEWRSRPIAIAGLTEHGALFCFEQLARDSGLRVVFRASHVAAAPGALSHSLTGPAPMLDACRGLDEMGSRWPDHIAGAVARCPLQSSARASGAYSTSQDAPSAVTRDRPLYSWVIAPVASASA